jgi:hypothetical protein
MFVGLQMVFPTLLQSLSVISFDECTTTTATTDLREGAELSNDVPKHVLRYRRLPEYHEATKIPDIVQDRHDDDIYQDICCR